MAERRLAHYELRDLLGAGGMGEVWRAHDERTGREVALKLLPDNLAHDAERLARFEREARTLASLNHPNIAALYGIEEHGGQPFLVMELVEGEELGARIPAGGLPLAEALDFARQLAEGLEEAHEKGIVHRDLKPANVKITPEGRLKILDFGLARAFTGDGVEEGDLAQSPTITAAMTQAGTILGTAAYMSPEQARGKPVDRRADNWAFGALLWEMLTGQRLFEGETISDTLASVLKESVPWDSLPGELPEGVRRLLERCLERDPRKRLRDIGEARVRLERWRDDPGSMHDSFARVDAPGELAPVRRALPWAVAVAAILLAAAGWWQAATRGSGQDPVPATSFHVELSGETGLAMTQGPSVILSPVGRHLAFRTRQAIHVRPLDSLEPIALPGTGDAGAVCFSPDGKWIAYNQRGRLRRVSITGGAPVDIGPAPDSRGIAWVDEARLVVSAHYFEGLTLFDLVDGSSRALTTPDSSRSERSHRWPYAIPGTDEVLFMCQYAGMDYDQGDLQVLSLSTGERRTIHRGGAFPRWSPTGHLLFVRDNSIFAVPWRPGDDAATGIAVPVLSGLLSSVGDQENDNGSAQFDLGCDGTLAWVQGKRAAMHSIPTLLRFDDGSMQEIGPPGLYNWPDVSPDGRWLVTDLAGDSEPALHLVELETGVGSNFTPGNGSHSTATWSPDSRTLYWCYSSNDGVVKILSRPADGSAPATELLRLPTLAVPSDVSPDGRWLLFNGWAGGNGWDLQLLDLQAPGSAPETIVNQQGDQVGGLFSPDGRWLVYGDITGEEDVIFLRRFPDDGAQWQVWSTRSPGFDGGAWAPGGDAIILRGAGGVHRVPLDFSGGGVRVGRPERIHSESDAVFPARNSSTAILPDGSGMVFLRPVGDTAELDAAPRVILATGWTRQLARRLASDD